MKKSILPLFTCCLMLIAACTSKPADKSKWEYHNVLFEKNDTILFYRKGDSIKSVEQSTGVVYKYLVTK